MSSRLADGGLVVEGTCDELGRICTWVAFGPGAVPLSLTVSLALSLRVKPSRGGCGQGVSQAAYSTTEPGARSIPLTPPT